MVFLRLWTSIKVSFDGFLQQRLVQLSSTIMRLSGWDTVKQSNIIHEQLEVMSSKILEILWMSAISRNSGFLPEESNIMWDIEPLASSNLDVQLTNQMSFPQDSFVRPVLQIPTQILIRPDFSPIRTRLTTLVELVYSPRAI